MKKAATNQFTLGLIMDLNPLITPNTVLTDALNATIRTNNGNEGILLNDMGNGRVETAYLPEGYIPVGSCEFGDIIYIASYNPLINKCLLGCFPSPLRNISSSSISDLRLSLSSEDFLELIKINNPDDSEKPRLVPTGKLTANSVKKIVYQNNLTSGDKYIIASEGISREPKITDIGNTSHVKDDFPKLLKIKLISIEDDGKITELTDGLKWYKDSLLDFFLIDKNIDRENDVKPDIDEWRSAVTSAYCIFSSKVSGKLALLAELESITGFSCTWGVNTNKNENLILKSIIKINDSEYEVVNGKVTIDDNEYNVLDGKIIIGDKEYSVIEYTGITLDYDIHFLCNWETENNNINPAGIVLTKSSWDELPNIHLYEYNLEELKLEAADQYSVREVPQCFPIDDEVKRLNPSNYYHSEFSRHYTPETFNLAYSSFKENFEYDVYLKNTLNIIKGKDPYKDIKDIDFTKIVRSSSDSNYYLNAEKYAEGKYYTIVNDEYKEILPFTIKDDIVNNTFKYPIKKEFTRFTFPVQLSITLNEVELLLTKSDGYFVLPTYKYLIAPYMPYGILELYALDGIINFNLIGEDYRKLTTYKYYNLPGYCTFTWGMEAYTEPDHIIPEVVFEFYDNLGIAAALHSFNRESYNGVFTNYITFGASGVLTNTDANGGLIYHRGLDIDKSNLIIGKEYLSYEKDDDGNVINVKPFTVPIEGMPSGTDNKFYCENDAGIIYPNLLYLVKITIKYAQVGPLGLNIPLDSRSKIEYRWLWTTSQFNEFYYQTQDFKNIQFTLNFDPEMLIELTDNWALQTNEDKFAKDPNIVNESIDLENPLSLSAILLLVEYEKEKPNMRIRVGSGFQNNHGVFYLKESSIKETNEDGTPTSYNNDGLNAINTKVYLGNEKVTNSPEQPSIKFSNYSDKTYNGIQPDNVIGGLEGDYTGGQAFTAYNYGEVFPLKNRFNFGFEETAQLQEAPLVYYDANFEEQTTERPYYIETTLLDAYKNAIDLKFFGEHYSKYYYTTKPSYLNAKILKSFITHPNDLEKYYIDLDTKIFNRIVLLNKGDKGGQKLDVGFPIYSFRIDSNDKITSERLSLNSSEKPDRRHDSPLSDMWNDNGEEIKSTFLSIFPYVWAKSKGGANWDVVEYRDNSNGSLLYKLSPEYYTIDDNNNDIITYLGSCAVVDMVGNLNLADPVEEGKKVFKESISARSFLYDDMAPVYYGKRISQLLQHCFYVSGYENTEVRGIDNWIYLDNNYSLYNRDIIIELSLEDGVNANDCIVFGSSPLNVINYSSYLLAVKKNSGLDPSNRIFSDPNVMLKINSCLKTFPFIIQFLYIRPSMLYTKIEPYVVKALEDVQSNVYQAIKGKPVSLLTNKIYCLYNLNDEFAFDELSSNQKIKFINYAKTEQEFSLTDAFVSRLTVDNGLLRLSGRMPSVGLYDITFSNLTHRRITNIPKGIAMFKNEPGTNTVDETDKQ